MIRQATLEDSGRISELLYQVHDVHAQLRPDRFHQGERKFSDEALEVRLADQDNPVFVYLDEQEVIQGYIFCDYQYSKDIPALVKRKELFIDDLCVDASQRGKGVGELLYQHALALAKENDCDSVTLHVWNENAAALRFYERLGMKPLYTTMEQRLR